MLDRPQRRPAAPRVHCGPGRSYATHNPPGTADMGGRCCRDKSSGGGRSSHGHLRDPARTYKLTVDPSDQMEPQHKPDTKGVPGHPSDAKIGTLVSSRRVYAGQLHELPGRKVKPGGAPGCRDRRSERAAAQRVAGVDAASRAVRHRLRHPVREQIAQPGPLKPGCRLVGEFLYEQHVRVLTAYQLGNHLGPGPADERTAPSVRRSGEYLRQRSRHCRRASHPRHGCPQRASHHRPGPGVAGNGESYALTAGASRSRADTRARRPRCDIGPRLTWTSISRRFLPLWMARAGHASGCWPCSSPSPPCCTSAAKR